ncbi:type I-B CRISPR-associated protein Cas7/Cst2/DevR [Enterococcus rivorum]
MNLAQAEIHRSYYRYTVTIDLDEIGIDKEYDIEINNAEKARRVNKLMDILAFLYRDIRGRREDLKPLFIIGGVYDVKNPVFQNAVDVKKNKIDIEKIEGVLYESIQDQTLCGVVANQFVNDSEIKEKLHATNIPTFFKEIKSKVTDYYESN